jgi:hypothetical protein
MTPTSTPVTEATMTSDRDRIDNDDASRDEARNRTDDERKIGLSASRTGDRDKDDDLSDIGGTDEMGSETGGLAGTSR